MNFENMTAADKAIFISQSISKHGGKMSGIPSISTSALCNEFCTSCSGCGLAPQHCYAKKYIKLRPALAAKLESNTEFYTNIILSSNDIPTINAAICRFESFGELQNETQLYNYCNIAYNNEHCNFTLWTKRPEIIAAYAEKHVLPDNLNKIFSSPVINQSKYEEYMELYGGLFNAVFTVYTKEYAAKHNININCGGRHCLDCMKCYGRMDHNKPIEINELLK